MLRWFPDVVDKLHKAMRRLRTYRRRGLRHGQVRNAGWGFCSDLLGNSLILRIKKEIGTEESCALIDKSILHTRKKLKQLDFGCINNCAGGRRTL